MKDYLIDTHAHADLVISNNEFDNNGEEYTLKKLISDMEEYHVGKIIIPSVENAAIENITELINNNNHFYGMVGIFPSEAKTYSDDIEKKLEEIARNNKKVVAVGEIGLDYYWDKSFVNEQKEVFKKQIELANRLELPIVVHDRDAHKDTFDILKATNKNSEVLFHCFSGSVEFMKECVKQGWYIAIGGVVTFKNAVKMKDVAREIPLDKLVLETDSPYLTPVPYRGKLNKPAYVKFVAEEIAKIRNISFDEIVDITTTNAERFFKI